MVNGRCKVTTTRVDVISARLVRQYGHVAPRMVREIVVRYTL